MTYTGKDRRGLGSPPFADKVTSIFKLFGSAGSAFAIISVILWNAYGKEAVNVEVQSQLKPLQEKVTKLEEGLEQAAQERKEISYSTKTTYLMIRKFVPDSIVKAAEREARIFKD